MADEIFPMRIMEQDEPDYRLPQKAVIAFSSINSDAAVIWCTPALADDMENSGVDAGDCFGCTGQEGGIRIWEGRIVVSYGRTPETQYECDVEYDGETRPPTPEEWAAIRAGDEEALGLIQPPRKRAEKQD